MGNFFATVLVFTFFALPTYAETTAFNLELSQQKCSPQTTTEPLLYSSDFHWDYSFNEMSQRFDEIYNSGKRLDARAYFDKKTDQFYLVWRDDTEIKKVKLSEQFLRSVTRHIEVSLKNKFANFIFFPDMGHSHLYFAEDHWASHYLPVPDAKQYNQHYEKMLNDPNMRALYHTAEQLRTKDKATGKFYNSDMEFRFWNRNPVGDNTVPDTMTIYTNPTHSANTVSEIKGYYLWSAGYNISSSKDGCFAYYSNGKTLFFDISLYDLATDPSKPSDGY